MDVGGLLDDLVEAQQQRGAAGEDDALFHDVAGQFRRGPFEDAGDGVHNGPYVLPDAVVDLIRVDFELDRHAGDIVLALGDHGDLLTAPVGGTEDLLQFLRSLIADENVALSAAVFFNALVEGVARDLDGGGHRHGTHGNDGDVRGAAPEVDDHDAVGLHGVHACPDGGRQRFFHEAGLAGPAGRNDIEDGAPLQVRDRTGHADDDIRFEDLILADGPDEIAEHLFGDREVGDDPFPHGTDDFDGTGLFSHHVVGLASDGDDLAGGFPVGHHGRLGHDDALALKVHDDGSGPKIDPDVSSKHVLCSPSAVRITKILLFFPSLVQRKPQVSF